MIQNKIYGTISYSGGGSDDFYYISIGSGMDTQTIMMFEGNLLIGGTMIESVAVNIGGGGGGGGSSGGSGFGGFGSFGFGGNGGFFGFSASEVGTMATGGGLFAAALQDRATINQNYEYKYGTKTQSAEDLTKLNKARMEKIASGAKGVGNTLGVIAAGVSVYEAYKNPTTANIIKATVNMGLLLIRMNPAANIALTILDLSGGSEWIYNQVGDFIDNK